ncbi:MAG: HIT domain-containing protein [Actinomycetes bacterium]
MTQADCLFCSIVSGENPATVIREDNRTLAFMDINPATRGHCLVIPKQHSDDLTLIDPEDIAACSIAAQELAQRAISKLGADGVALISFAKPAAGQTVFHTHLHVIPRYEGDGLKQPWIPNNVDAAEIESAAKEMSND